MKKIALISILIIEALFIVILGLQILYKSKENLNLRLEIKQAMQDIQSKEATLKDLSSQLEESHKAKSELEVKVRDLTEAHRVVEAKMEGMKTATDTLARQFDTQQKDMFKQLDDLTEKNKETIIAFLDRIRSIIHMKFSSEYIPPTSVRDIGLIKQPGREVTLKKIVVKKPKAQEMPIGPEPVGKVLNVDNKYNLVIVDVGLEHGVKPGMKYTVLRDQKRIGQIVLREIYKGMSVAETVLDKTDQRIKQGDTIARLD